MFNITLIAVKDLKFVDEKTLLHESYYTSLDEADSCEELLSLICSQIQDDNTHTFKVEGFDQIQSVDCRTDLLCVIEQIPEILANITNRNFNFNLDFYEQGVEKILEFKDNEKYVKVLCRDMLSGNLIFKENNVSKKCLEDMFKNIYDEFLKVTQIMCPYILNHKQFYSFLKIKDLL